MIRMKFHHENEVFMSDEGEKDYNLNSLRGKYEGIVLDATAEDNKDGMNLIDFKI